MQTPIKMFELTNDAVGATFEDVGEEIVLNGQYEHLVIQVQNNSAASGDDLDDFEISLKVHPGAEWLAYLTGAAWATASTYLSTLVSTDPKTLAKGAKTHINVYIGPVYSVKFRAKAANGKSVKLKIFGTAKGSLR